MNIETLHISCDCRSEELKTLQARVKELEGKLEKVEEGLEFYVHAGPMELMADADYVNELGFTVMKPGKRARQILAKLRGGKG